MLAMSVVASVAPMGSFIALIWFLDRYDREPVWLMALTFLWGAVGAVLISIVVSGLFTIPIALIAPESQMALGTAIIAPLVEEPAKALVLLPLLLSRHFDNTTDGFVYGATAGLGFAMSENLIYFAVEGLGGEQGAFVQTVLVRTFYTGVMHAAATAAVGACIGLAHFRGWTRLAIGACVGLTVGMGIHALWNGLLTLDLVAGLDGVGFVANLLIFPMELVFVFGLFQMCLLNEKAVIRRELEREAREERTLPAAHAQILSSWLKRTYGRDWLPSHIARGPYVRTATTLAMRRHQRKLLGDQPQAEFYSRQIVHLRKELHDLQVER